MKAAFLFFLLFTFVGQVCAEKAGFIIMAKGQVSAVNEAGEARVLKRRSPVYEKDTIVTEADGKVQIKFDDGAVIALKENSALRIDGFQYNGQQADEQSFLTLVKGGMRAISGAVGKKNPDDYQVATPVATIGIRGTYYELQMRNGLDVAVWEGGISVCARAGGQCRDDELVEFGWDRDFRFGHVGMDGMISGSLQAPPGIHPDFVSRVGRLEKLAKKQAARLGQEIEARGRQLVSGGALPEHLKNQLSSIAGGSDDGHPLAGAIEQAGGQLGLTRESLAEQWRSLALGDSEQGAGNPGEVVRYASREFGQQNSQTGVLQELPAFVRENPEFFRFVPVDDSAQYLANPLLLPPEFQLVSNRLNDEFGGANVLRVINQLVESGAINDPLLQDARISLLDLERANRLAMMVVASNTDYGLASYFPNGPTDLYWVAGKGSSVAAQDPFIMDFGSGPGADGNFPSGAPVVVARGTVFTGLDPYLVDIIPATIDAGMWDTGQIPVRIQTSPFNATEGFVIADDPLFVLSAPFTQPAFSVNSMTFSRVGTFAGFAGGAGSAGQLLDFKLSFDANFVTSTIANGLLTMASGDPSTAPDNWDQWTFSGFGGVINGAFIQFGAGNNLPVSGMLTNINAGLSSEPAALDLAGFFTDSFGESVVGYFNAWRVADPATFVRGIWGVGAEQRLLADQVTDFDRSGFAVISDSTSFGLGNANNPEVPVIWSRHATDGTSAVPTIVAGNVQENAFLRWDSTTPLPNPNGNVINLSQVEWGTWEKADVWSDPLSNVADQNIAAPVHWVVGEATHPDVVAAQTGTMTFGSVPTMFIATSHGASAASRGTLFGAANLSLSVNFDNGVISNGLMDFTTQDGATPIGNWHVEFGGSIAGNSLALSVNPATSYFDDGNGNSNLSPASGIAGQFVGQNAVSGVMGAFKVMVDTDATKHAEGVFLVQ